MFKSGSNSKMKTNSKLSGRPKVPGTSNAGVINPGAQSKVTGFGGANIKRTNVDTGAKHVVPMGPTVNNSPSGKNKYRNIQDEFKQTMTQVGGKR